MPDASFDDASSWPALGGVKGRAGAVAMGIAPEIWPPLFEEAECARSGSQGTSAPRGRGLPDLKSGRSRTDLGEFTEAPVVSTPGILKTSSSPQIATTSGSDIVTVGRQLHGER